MKKNESDESVDVESKGNPAPDRPDVLEDLPTPLRPFFAPVLKLAFGTATGSVFAVLFAFFAAFNAVSTPDGTDFVWLLGQHFLPGYGPSAVGALLGIPWGFALGFVAGWLVAFGRNLVIAIWIFIVGARQRLSEGVSAFDAL